MPDTVVTIKLSGPDYRTLCNEGESYSQLLQQQLKQMPAGPDKHAALTRLAMWQGALDKVRGV